MFFLVVINFPLLHLSAEQRKLKFLSGGFVESHSEQNGETLNDGMDVQKSWFNLNNVDV